MVNRINTATVSALAMASQSDSPRGARGSVELWLVGLIRLGKGLALAAACSAGHGAPITLSLPYADFGKVENRCYAPMAPGGVCAAAAMVNSFEYLRVRFPALYSNLIPDSDNDQDIDLTDLRAARDSLAVGTWGDSNQYKGIYARTGGLEDLWNAKLDWFNYYAPNTTIFEGEVKSPIEKFELTGALDGSRIASMAPSFSFLVESIKAKQDIEIAFNDPTGGGGINHAVTLTGITYDPDNANVRSIYYLDSNDPTANVPKKADLSLVDGALRFTLNGNTQQIYLAFAESPNLAPEPSSVSLVALAGLGAALCGRRSNRRFARRSTPCA